MKFANVKCIGFDALLKSLSLLMKFSADQNVGLVIISFFGHVLQGTLFNFKLSSVYIYIYIHIIYILHWAFLTIRKVCKGRNSSNVWWAPLTRYFLLHILLVFESLQCSLTSLFILLLCCWLFGVFLSWSSSDSSVSLHIIPPKMAALPQQAALWVGGCLAHV